MARPGLAHPGAEGVGPGVGKVNDHFCVCTIQMEGYLPDKHANGLLVATLSLLSDLAVQPLSSQIPRETQRSVRMGSFLVGATTGMVSDALNGS